MKTKSDKVIRNTPDEKRTLMNNIIREIDAESHVDRTRKSVTWRDIYDITQVKSE